MTERIAPGTWVVELPFPQASVVEATNCYLLADAAGGVHLVDPGWDTDETLALLEAGLAEAGFTLADVRSVIATHLHPDHLGLGSRLHREHGIPVALHRAEHASLGRPQFPDPDGTLVRWGVPESHAAELRTILEPRANITGLTGDVVLDDGERLDIPGRDIVVVHTPGHTAGSLCLHDREHDLFFSGDHVLPTVNPGIGLGGFADEDDPIGAALASYATVAAYDSAEVLPGHGARFHGLAARATRTADRHRRRSAEIADLVAADPAATIWDIASRVAWTGGWESFAPFLRMTSLTQTEMHLRHLSRGTLDA